MKHLKMPLVVLASGLVASGCGGSSAPSTSDGGTDGGSLTSDDGQQASGGRGGGSASGSGGATGAEEDDDAGTESNSSDGGGGDDGAATVIGPDGGTVESDDGRVTLTIPGGALDESVAISITAIDPSDSESGLDPSDIALAYRLEPDGLTFDEPARIEVVSSESVAVSNASSELNLSFGLTYSDGELETWEGDIVVDGSSDDLILTGEISHFSEVIVTRSDYAGTMFTVTYPEQACEGVFYNVTLTVGHAAGAGVGTSMSPRFLIGPNENNPVEEAQGNDSLYPGMAQEMSQTFTDACRVGEPPLLAMLGLDGYVLGGSITRTGLTYFKVPILTECIPCEPTEPTEPTAGVHQTVTAPEGLSVIDDEIFAEILLVVSGSNGQILHSLEDGDAVFDLTQTEFDGMVYEGSPAYGSVFANGALVSVRPDGYFDLGFDTENGEFFVFGQLGLTGNNITDSTRAGSMGGSLLLANNTADEVIRLDPNSGAPGFTQVQTPLLAWSDHLAAVPGSVVSLYAPPGDEGPFLGISDDPGNPGQLFWVDPSNPGGLQVVGELPEGPRRIRCVEPAGTPCGVSSYAAGELTFLDWPDRDAPPTIAPDTVSVDGPVGIDLATLGGNVSVVSTGFNDDTLHITTLTSQLVPTDLSVDLDDCPNPGHAIFIAPDFVALTCNGGSMYDLRVVPVDE